MTKLVELNILNFRNLSDVSLTPGPRFNFVYGENASGKTSLLEAIHVLSTNKSFRTRNANYLIQHDKEAFTLFTQLEQGSADSIELEKLGVSRSQSKDVSLKVNGQSEKSSAALASRLPVIAIQPSSFELIDGPPNYRRALLDWLVFHVKPQFLEVWRDYQRCLKQRNMLLRSGNIDRVLMQHWNRLYIDAAVAIELLRLPILRAIDAQLKELLSANSLLSDAGIELMYRSGWGADIEIPDLADQADQGNQNNAEADVIKRFRAQVEEKLNNSFELDLKQGFSSVGSHRHDIRIKTKAGKASELLSRGQKKTLILSIYICLATYLAKHASKTSVFLLDDLPSELDTEHLSWLCEKINDLQVQAFISAVDHRAVTTLPIFRNKNISYDVFHVKQGSVIKVDASNENTDSTKTDSSNTDSSNMSKAEPVKHN